jgi:hypothetical protein
MLRGKFGLMAKYGEKKSPWPGYNAGANAWKLLFTASV